MNKMIWFLPLAVLLLAFMTPGPAQAQGIVIPYTESFESGDGGWTSGGTNNTWALGAPNDTTIIGASDGTQAWATGLTTDYNTNEQSYVLSPVFDFSALTVDPVISLDVWWEIVPDDGSAGASLQYSTDGATWNTLGAVGDPLNWYTHFPVYGLDWSASDDPPGWSGRDGGGSNGWRTATHSLAGLAEQSNVRLRVAFGSDGLSPTDDGFAFDNVRVYAGNTAPGCAIEPVPASGATDVLINTNLDWTGGPGGIPTGYQVYFGTTNPPTTLVTTTTAATTLYNPPAYLTHSTGYYWQIVPTNPYGDAASCPVWSFTTGAITPVPVTIAAPYVQDFEGGAAGWTSGGTHSSWAVGTPAGAVITGTVVGNNAWMTGLTAGYNADEQSYVASPVLDFSDLAHPYVKFDLWWNSAVNAAGAQLQVSTDGGATWTHVGEIDNSTNWYNVESVAGLNSTAGWSGSAAEDTAGGTYQASHGWRTAMHDLSGLADQPDVRLRFFFGANGSAGYDGFAFDNFEIRAGCVWKGDEEPDTDWHTANCWECGHVPGATEIAIIIPSGESTDSPIISSGVGTAAAVGMTHDYATLELRGGNLETRYLYQKGNLIVAAGAIITLTGNGIVWEATSADSPGNGLVRFSGSGVQRLARDLVNGTSTPSPYTVQFYDVQVDAGVTLDAPGALTVTHILTNNGILRQQQDVSGVPVTFFGTGGYGGLTVNPGAQNLGLTTVQIRGNQNCTSVAGETVKRCFAITSENAPASGVALTFYFAASELSGQTCAAMNVYHHDGTAWGSALTVSGRNCATAPYSITVTGVADFSPFALKSGPAAPTAVGARGAQSQNSLAAILCGVVGLGVGALALRRRRVRRA